MEMVATLKSSELFEGLDDEALGEIAHFSSALTLGEGGLLMTDQSDVRGGHDLYLVLDGAYDVIAHHPTNPEELMTLGNLDSEVVGEIAWLFGTSRTATVSSRGELRAVRIDGERFMAYLEAHPETGFLVMRRLLRGLSTKLIESNYYLF